MFKAAKRQERGKTGPRRTGFDQGAQDIPDRLFAGQQPSKAVCATIRATIAFVA